MLRLWCDGQDCSQCRPARRRALIYSQCSSKPSTACRQDSAFHLQTTGSMEELFPMSYRGAHSPFAASHSLRASVSFSVCLFVLLCLYVGSACLRLRPAYTQMFSPVSLSRSFFLSLSHKHKQTHKCLLFQTLPLRHWLAAAMTQVDSFTGSS